MLDQDKKYSPESILIKNTFQPCNKSLWDLRETRIVAVIIGFSAPSEDSFIYPEQSYFSFSPGDTNIIAPFFLGDRTPTLSEYIVSWNNREDTAQPSYSEVGLVSLLAYGVKVM